MWDWLKECPVLDQLLPAPMWWKMSTGVKTLSREDLSWTSDSQIAKTSHLTIEGMSSGHCPVGAATGVGKRPRKSKLLHASYLSTVQPLLSTALLLSTVLPSVRVCARGFRRCCSSSPTPASPPLVLRTPATMFPAGYKAFSNHRRLLSDQDCPRQHRPDAVNHGCAHPSWWVVTNVCSVIKIPHMEVPGKCQLQLLRCGRMYEKWHDMKSGNNGSRRQLRETRQTKLSHQKNNKNSQKIIAKKPTWRWKKWSCFHTVCSTDWIPLGLLVL